MAAPDIEVWSKGRPSTASRQLSAQETHLLQRIAVSRQRLGGVMATVSALCFVPLPLVGAVISAGARDWSNPAVLIALFTLLGLPCWAVGAVSGLIARDAFRLRAQIDRDRERGWAFMMSPGSAPVIPMSGRALVVREGRLRLGRKVRVRWTGNPQSESEPPQAGRPAQRSLSRPEIEELQGHSREMRSSARNPALWFFTLLLLAWLVVIVLLRPPIPLGGRIWLAVLAAGVALGHSSAFRTRRFARALDRDAAVALVGRKRSEDGSVLEVLASSSFIWTVDGRPAIARRGVEEGQGDEK